MEKNSHNTKNTLIIIFVLIFTIIGVYVVARGEINYIKTSIFDLNQKQNIIITTSSEKTDKLNSY